MRHKFNNKSTSEPVIKVNTLGSDYNLDTAKMIDLESNQYNFLKRIVFDLLYRKPELISNIKVYKSNKENSNSFIILGKVNKFYINIS